MGQKYKYCYLSFNECVRHYIRCPCDGWGCSPWCWSEVGKHSPSPPLHFCFNGLGLNRRLCVTQLTLYMHSICLLLQGGFKSLNHFSYSHLDWEPHSCSVCRYIVELQSYRWDQTSLFQMLTTFILYFFQWVRPYFFFFYHLSILGMHLFGCKFGSERDGDTLPDRKNFDSLLWAIVTVFQVRTNILYISLNIHVFFSFLFFWFFLMFVLTSLALQLTFKLAAG